MPRIERGQGPEYRQIANHYAQLIARGELEAGARIPSLVDISITWDVAHATATRAMSALKDLGLVSIIHGKGSFVRPTDSRGLATEIRELIERHTKARTTAMVFSDPIREAFHDRVVEWLRGELAAETDRAKAVV